MYTPEERYFFRSISLSFRVRSLLNMLMTLVSVIGYWCASLARVSEWIGLITISIRVIYDPEIDSSLDGIVEIDGV